MLSGDFTAFKAAKLFTWWFVTYMDFWKALFRIETLILKQILDSIIQTEWYWASI